MKFILFAVSLLLLQGCSSAPRNAVGAVYDADSYYCRELHKGEYDVERNDGGQAPTNQELYEQYCEPVGSWQARDPSGYSRKIKSEQSFLGQLIDATLE